jgi:hypothetical protein
MLSFICHFSVLYINTYISGYLALNNMVIGEC